MRFSAALLTAVLAAVTSASPLITFPPFVGGTPTSDPAFSVAQSDLDAGLECPTADKNNLQGLKPLLLVPGTGNTGYESWGHTWGVLSQQLGYTPCWVSPPPYMLNDSQANAEFVVNAIHKLYKSNGNKKVPIMSWSQGGLIVQWAFTFFPSTVGQSDRFISFAGDFKGTIFGYALDAVPFGIAPSVWQQSTFSAFLTALRNAGGLTAKIPTTSIYSITDEIVQPQIGGPAIESSYLNGAMATNVKVQDTCGPLFIVEHSQELFNAFTAKVATAALASKTGKAEVGTFGASDCSEGFPAGLSPADQLVCPTIIVQAAVHIVAGPRTSCEPLLKPYAKKYNPVAIQACNPLAQIINIFGPQTPALFNDYEALIYYILTHKLGGTVPSA